MIWYLAVLFAAILFGSIFSLAKVPLATINPLALSAIDYTIAWLSLTPFAKASFRFETGSEYFYLIIITIFGAVLPPVLLIYGLQKTDAFIAGYWQTVKLWQGGNVCNILVIIGLLVATIDELKVLEMLPRFRVGNVIILASMFMCAVENNNISRCLTSGQALPW